MFVLGRVPRVLTRPNGKAEMVGFGDKCVNGLTGNGCSVAALRRESKKSQMPGTLAFVPDQLRKEVDPQSVQYTELNR